MMVAKHVDRHPTSRALYTPRRAWEAQLARLVKYKAVHGDCNVPKGWAEDPALGSWVSNQRVLKRKLDRGEPCQGMTAERAASLEALGLAWELSTAAQNNPHRTQAFETGQALEVEAVVGKRRYDKGCLGTYNKTTMV